MGSEDPLNILWTGARGNVVIIGGTLQPVVVKNGLHGVPEHGVYAWDPGAHFGVYSPDTFYWERGHR